MILYFRPQKLSFHLAKPSNHERVVGSMTKDKEWLQGTLLVLTLSFSCSRKVLYLNKDKQNCLLNMIMQELYIK